MFSLQIESTLKSGIGQHLPLLQHLVSLAVVESVRTLGMGYENIDLRLKWPNDIYAGAQHKVGGVVVFTSILRDILQVFSIKFDISLSGSILLILLAQSLMLFRVYYYFLDFYRMWCQFVQQRAYRMYQHFG